MNRKSIESLLVGAAALMLVLQGCGTPVPVPGKSPSVRLLDIRRDTLFRIDTRSRISGIASWFQPPGSETVYFVDPENFSVHALHTGTGEFSYEGSVAGMEYFDCFSVDEAARRLFLFSEDSLVCYSLDCRRQFALSLHGITHDGFLSAVNRYFVPLVRGNMLFMHYFPDIDSSYKNPTFFAGAFEVKVDLRSKQVMRLGVRYPQNFRDRCYSYNYVPDRMELDAHTHAYTFPYNDSVFVYDLRKHTTKVHYFGSRLPKQSGFIDYADIPGLHQTVFDEFVSVNPYYLFAGNEPLAGYFTRQIMISDSGRPSPERRQRIVIYDRNFQYVGESLPQFQPHIVIDSKKGLLSLSFDGTFLNVNHWSW